MQAKRGLRLKKKAAECRAREDGSRGSSKGVCSPDDFKPLAHMSDDTRQQLASLLRPQFPHSLPPLPPSKLVKSQVCGAQETVSPECPQCEEQQQVWSSLPPPNLQLLTRQPPRLLSMEELCRGPSAECTTSVERRRSRSVRGQPQHKTADHGTDLGGLDPLPSAQGAGVPGATTGAGGSVEGGSVRGAGGSVEGAGGSVEGAGGYGSDLDLFEDEEFDRLCQDVELVYEGSSSDSGLPAVSLVAGVAGDTQRKSVGSKTKPVSYLKTEVTSEHKPGSRLAAKVPPTPRPRQGEAARVLTPEACPMCSMQFPHGFSRVDVEQHIAACLAGDLKDFEEDDVIVLD